jgi:hypothetical protein
MRVGEAVHLGEKEREDAAVAEFQEGIAENVAEELGQVRTGLGVADGLDAFGEEGDALVAEDGLRQEGAPAVGGRAGR